jgi:hypothetical protein
MRLNDHGATNEDIMAEFKNKRFAIAPDYLEFSPTGVVLTDFEFWSNNYTELGDWCGAHQCILSGMTVTMPDEKTLMLFCLKWS